MYVKFMAESFRRYSGNACVYIEISLNTFKNILNYMCDLEPFSKIRSQIANLKMLNQLFLLLTNITTVNDLGVAQKLGLVYVA